jgi:Ca2+-transporting ATPase
MTHWSITSLLANMSFSSQVLSVGVNTKWGLLMASTSEDTGEETPLQVCFLRIWF